MKPDRPESVADKVTAALDRLSRARRMRRQTHATAHGLSPLQVELLVMIAGGPPPEPQVGLLAAEVGVSQPTVSDSLASLEHKGLLERRRDGEDARRILPRLTPPGRRVAVELGGADSEFDAAIRTLTTDAQADLLETLLTLIARLADTGAITVARTCLTCHHHDHDGTTHTCSLLHADLPPADLRVNCPEHQPA